LKVSSLYTNRSAWTLSGQQDKVQNLDSNFIWGRDLQVQS
jgi:hypothetical protein